MAGITIAVIEGDGIGKEVVPEGIARASKPRRGASASTSPGTDSTGAATTTRASAG